MAPAAIKNEGKESPSSHRHALRQIKYTSTFYTYALLVSSFYYWKCCGKKETGCQLSDLLFDSSSEDQLKKIEANSTQSPYIVKLFRDLFIYTSIQRLS